jgi:hypothetical protein
VCPDRPLGAFVVLVAVQLSSTQDSVGVCAVRSQRVDKSAEIDTSARVTRNAKALFESFARFFIFRLGLARKTLAYWWRSEALPGFWNSAYRVQWKTASYSPLNPAQVSEPRE